MPDTVRIQYTLPTLDHGAPLSALFEGLWIVLSCKNRSYSQSPLPTGLSPPADAKNG